MFVLVLQKLALEFLLDFFYFPIWWYTAGALRALKWCLNLFKDGNRNLAPGLWLANIFVPMFGQNDLQGRFISFIMRFFQIIARAIGLAIWLIFCLILSALWLAIPVLIVYGIFASFKSPYGI
ncbi:MAG: hypothetical protein AAB348_02995 [Patescibacteria group bacterium]